MEVEEIVVLESAESRSTSPRRGGGISPLPEIRAVVIGDRQVQDKHSIISCRSDNKGARLTGPCTENSNKDDSRYELRFSAISNRLWKERVRGIKSENWVWKWSFHTLTVMTRDISFCRANLAFGKTNLILIVNMSFLRDLKSWKMC